MKLLISVILILNIQSLDLNSIRYAYKDAAQDKNKVESFHKQFAKITKDDAIELVAYKGAAISLLGKHAKKIKDKKRLFIEGVELVEYAIKKAPNNIEVRFIRLGIQENTPKILRYKGNIEEDTRTIFKLFNTISSSSLKEHIRNYILQSKAFSDEEKEVILNQ